MCLTLCQFPCYIARWCIVSVSYIVSVSMLHCKMVYCLCVLLCVSFRVTLQDGVLSVSYFVSVSVLHCKTVYCLCVLHCVSFRVTIQDGVLSLWLTLCQFPCYIARWCIVSVSYFVSVSVLPCKTVYCLCVIHCVSFRVTQQGVLLSLCLTVYQFPGDYHNVTI